MRLSSFERKVIKTTVLTQDEEAIIYVFGSRVDDQKRGGDIDLLILSKKIDLEMKLKISVAIQEKIGAQKIDILVAKTADENPFVEMAVVSGVLL